MRDMVGVCSPFKTRHRKGLCLWLTCPLSMVLVKTDFIIFQEITDLNTELKNREVKHTSAQSRLRSQNKILEKTIKDLNNEIDSYKQKLKMIESENTRMIRGNNSKILQEINRNIAKLSTNVNTTHHIVSSNIDCSNSARPAVANVISHKNQVADISKPNLLKDKSCEDDNDDQLRLIPKKPQGNEHDNNVEGESSSAMQTKNYFFTFSRFST